ncbi:MAG: hypothetical protein K0U47_03110 [Epsilonproteobacteria bacterium]|nr:hypothetical protein [Campylobacterota bacterium]
MAHQYTLTYKEEIEKLSEETDFEKLGDARYMFHDDVAARLEWAFYRPSGSHPDQVSDPDEMVSIMAFNHSRLAPMKRYTRLHPNVIKEERLRVKIRSRSRMLFRAMVDDDFTELIEVLTFAPVFLPQAIDQMINGRIWNETYANLQAATTFITMVASDFDENLQAGIKRRLQPIKNFTFEEAKAFLITLTANTHTLHPFILAHFHHAYEQWLKRQTLHPLQRIALQKEIDRIEIA